MVLTPLCDHRDDAKCGEDIGTKLLRAQNARDKTYNEKGYVNGKKELPSSSDNTNTNPRSKTTHFSLKMKDGSYVNYENKGACKENGPCDCSNLKKGLSCHKNRGSCDCPGHGHRFQSKNSVGDLEKHRGPYRNPKQHDAQGGSGKPGTGHSKELSQASNNRNFVGENIKGEQVHQSCAVDGKTEHITHKATKWDGDKHTTREYKNESPVDSQFGQSKSYTETAYARGSPFQTVREGNAKLNKDSHTIEDSSVEIAKERVEMRPEVLNKGLEGLERGAMHELAKNEKTLHLTFESKVNAIVDSGVSTLKEGASSGGHMLLKEKFGAVLETCPTASEVMAPASQCLDSAGLPVPTGIIHESNRLGLNFAGGHSVSVGERARTGESSQAGSKVSARQVENGVQYRLGVPQTAGIVGFDGNVGVTETVTHMESGSKVSVASAKLTGATCRADVLGGDVGLHFDTGLRESHMLEHEKTGWLSSKTTETHSKGVQLLGCEVTKLSSAERCKESNLLASREVTTDHISGKVSEVNTYGPEHFAIMEVKSTGTLHPNGEVHGQATSYSLGEGGHMVAGAGAAGAVQGACDLLDGKSLKEAVHDGGSVLAQNVKDCILMKATGLPLIRSDSQHTEVTFENGTSVGWGHESRDLHVPEGDLQQTTDGLQLGVGIPGDPLGVIQGRAALGHTVDHVAYGVKEADGTERHHQASYKTSGLELDLSLGNRALNPLRLGHVTEESFDESCKVENGAKTEIQELHKSDGVDLGVGFTKDLESKTSVTTTSAEGGVSTTHETFQGRKDGFRTGIVNHSHAEGNFKEDTLCKDHSWTSKDGVTHHESLKESYSGIETRDHTTAFFGSVDFGTSVTQHGDFVSEKHSGNSSTCFKDGQKIQSVREEMTQSHGTKYTNNGSVVSENLAVHKVVEEHQTIQGEGGTTTRDVWSTFDGVERGTLNHTKAEGNFKEDTLCKDHSWTSKDGVTHHESLQESYSGNETHDHTTGSGPSVTQHGDFVSKKHSGNSSTYFKDGQKIESVREEVTKSQGTMHTNNGSVVSENLAVHKVVEEQQTIEGEGGTTTRDVQSTFDGKHIRNGLSESSHGTWVSQEHLHSKTLDVTIRSQTAGEESGQVSAEPQNCDVQGTESHQLMSHQYATESFEIHNGRGDLHYENCFFATDVRGQMHWDDKGKHVIVDETTTHQITLSAPVNCAIGAVTSSALQLVASQGYLSALDALNLCAIGTGQFMLFKFVEQIAIQVGTKWLTPGLVLGLCVAAKELWQTYYSPSLSTWSKLGHSSFSLLSGGGTLFLYWWLAQNPLLSIYASSGRFLQETFKHLSDGWSGNLEWHFVCEDILRNPNLGAAGAGLLGAKAGLALGMLTGPLGMGLGTAIGAAVGSVLGMLGWTSWFEWLWGPAIAKELQYAYTFLGVAPDASDEEVIKAYRLKALKLHPDKPGGSEEQFKLLNAHYERILCGRMVQYSGNSKEHFKCSSGENKMLDDIDSDSQSTSIGHDFL